MSTNDLVMKVEKLKELRLDVPQVRLLAFELQRKGVRLPDGILTIQELADALIHMKSNTGLSQFVN